MTIKVTSKNVDLGDSLRTYASDRINEAVDKYSNRPATGHVSVEKASRGGFSTLCAIYLDSGIDLQANGEAADAYASVDAAIERLEKRLRRYKRRLKNHHHHGSGHASADDSDTGVDYVIQAGGEDDDGAGPERDENGPVIVAEMPARVRRMSVSDAVMQMDLADQTFLVFRNASHGGVNVVYRRPDGNIGWIDPSGVVSQEQT